MGSCRILGIRTGLGFDPCINAIVQLGVAGEPCGCSKSCRILGISRIFGIFVIPFAKIAVVIDTYHEQLFVAAIVVSFWQLYPLLAVCIHCLSGSG